MEGKQRASQAAHRSTISVIICAYTEARWEHLVRSVECVARQTLPPLEIIVVVDHNPELLERVRRELPETTALANANAPGLSGARNTGVAVSNASLVAFVDDDAVAEPDWLERLVRSYAPGVIGVGGSVDPLWTSGRPSSFPAEFDWVVGCTYTGMPKMKSRVRNLIGANMSLRREVFAEVGGFHTGIGRVGTRPVGCEETELCIRALRRWPDATIVYEPEARVRHVVPSERGTWRYFASRCYSEGLSKAVVARLCGATAGLATERAYTRQVLPKGIARGLGDALRGDASGLGRSVAILAGLSITAAGYLVGRTRTRAGASVNGPVELADGAAAPARIATEGSRGG